MNYKIVSDSSSNLMELEGIDYATVPLKIIAGDREFVDNRDLDVSEMVAYLKKHKGKSGSSCPNVQEWLEAYEGAKNIIAMTISGPLSGSYAAAQNAAEEFAAENPDANIFVLDSQSTGPEMCLLIDKIKELVAQKLDFQTVKERLIEYHKNLHTLFCLESLTNLARNGRVSAAVATIAGVLGIRVCGDLIHGQITQQHKPRGQKKAMETLLNMMKERGLVDGANIHIAHCFAPENAEALKQKILGVFPNCKFNIRQTTALCSFYAEQGGMIICMEGGPHQYKY